MACIRGHPLQDITSFGQRRQCFDNFAARGKTPPLIGHKKYLSSMKPNLPAHHEWLACKNQGRCYSLRCAFPLVRVRRESPDFAVLQLRVKLGAVILCVIFSATCNATLENVFVALAEMRCYAMQRHLSNLQPRFVPAELGHSQLARRGRWSVGFTKKNTSQRSRLNCLPCELLRGDVTLCNSCKFVRLLDAT